MMPVIPRVKWIERNRQEQYKDIPDKWYNHTILQKNTSYQEMYSSQINNPVHDVFFLSLNAHEN